MCLDYPTANSRNLTFKTNKMDSIKFKEQPPITNAPIANGDIRIVELPMEVLFEWSDKIVADYDSETDTVLEYTSGWVMHILRPQKHIYNNQPTQLVASAFIEKPKN
jgi:hypothetical protein